MSVILDFYLSLSASAMRLDKHRSVSKKDRRKTKFRRGISSRAQNVIFICVSKRGEMSYSGVVLSGTKCHWRSAELQHWISTKKGLELAILEETGLTSTCRPLRRPLLRLCSRYRFVVFCFASFLWRFLLRLTGRKLQL